VTLAVLVAAPAQMAAAADSGLGVAVRSAGLSAAPATIPPDERMLVESDQLVYDYDNNTVSAVGNVRIYYAGYTLEAATVTYDQTSGRLIAIGNVTLVDPTGATIHSEHVDVTDDFRDGFVQSLRVDTPQRTHFEADSAARADGSRTTFVNGVYTACETCADRPDKPPLWNVRAATIVVDEKEQMIYFTDARVEFFGMPVAWLPRFAMVDPSVKRKSGFLSPSFGYSDRLGVSASLPYYWAPAPNYDITLSPRVYSRQGLLGEIEWRHRLDHGQYAVKAAGIYQLDKDAFAMASPSYRNLRGGIRTTGEFYLNRDWTLGWDGTLSTDRTFTRDYGALNSDTSETISTVHLTGLRDRNYMNVSAYSFQILTDQSAPGLLDPAAYDQGRQAIVVPSIDKHRIVDDVWGGELSMTTNITALSRDDDDPITAMPTTYHGTAGEYVRATKEIAWQRRFVGAHGQVLTPFASVRGDAFYLSGQTTGAIDNGLTPDSTAYRFMPTVGFDWSLPILVTAGSSTHIVEPIAQLVVRPNEMMAGLLPNNDSQSQVFDDTNLFDHDKSSGFDGQEGGTRANVGVRLHSAFDSGATVEATVGQSIHLAGVNSYASADLANVGPLSGLETTFSDYVAAVSVNGALGPRLSARGRFDPSSLSINRLEVEATTALGPVTGSTSYIYQRLNPNSGVTAPSSVLRTAASVNVVENWRAFGTLTYDVSGSAIASDSFGIAYDDECLTMSLAYSEVRAGYTDLSADRWVSFRLQMRTLGEGGFSTSLSKI
jgi:LPS-assembly protein